MKKLLFLYLISFLTVFMSCNEDEKEISRSGSLKVYVSNEFGQSIEEVTVVVGSHSRTTVSGEVYFPNLPIGEHELSLSKSSYVPISRPIEIREKKTTEIEIHLVAGQAFINISEPHINISHVNGSVTVDIQSNSSWGIDNNSSWLESSISKGEGNATVNISYLKNKGDTIRKDSIYFISDTVKRKLIIEQSFPLRIMKIEGILGNQELDIKDSVFILFNKPVDVESIQSNWEYCHSAINYSQENDQKGIKFTYACAELGGEYPFSIRIKQDGGVPIVENIEVPFYESKLDIEGFISDIILIEEDKEVLIATLTPSRIIRYSIERDTIIQTYDFSTTLAPLKIVYNAYSDLVYVMGDSDPYAFSPTVSPCTSPKVYSLNYKTGNINLAFQAYGDEFDHPSHPVNVPYDIGFTHTGLGVVLLRSNGTSAIRWKIIDSSNNDSIYNYPDYNETNITRLTYFNSVHTNFDASKLYITQAYGGVDYGIYDGQDGSMSIIQPSSTTRGDQITAHKKEEKLYVRQLYDQFVMDLEGNLSGISYLDSRHDGKADFSYRQNEDNIIYICEAQSFTGYPNRFLMLDYNATSTLMSSSVIEGLQEFSSTIDGKYGVAYKLNSDVSSSFYKFKTDMFYSHVY